jgi:hypothetical protein
MGNTGISMAAAITRAASSPNNPDDVHTPPPSAAKPSFHSWQTIPAPRWMPPSSPIYRASTPAGVPLGGGLAEISRTFSIRSEQSRKPTDLKGDKAKKQDVVR